MRILFPTLARFPSSEAPAVQVANMAQAFAELGHEVRLVVPAADASSNPIPPTVEAMEELFGFRPSFEVVTLSRTIHRGQSYLHAARIARLARVWRTDLLFSRNLRACLIPALRGVPTVFEAHTLTALTGPQERWVIRRLQRADGFRGIVAISQMLADDLTAELGIPPQRIVVAHDAVRIDPSATVPPPTTRGRSDRITVGYTGSMFPGRGVDLLISLAADDERVELHLVGGPSAAAEAWATSAPSAVGEGRIVIHGPVSPRAAREIQSRLDVLVAPFAKRVLTDSGVDSSRWMSPMKVFEYMASGRPMITSDLPVLREVLRPGVDALMLPPEDIDALRAAIAELLEKPELGHRLAVSAFERARREFTWARRASTVLARFSRISTSAQPA